jgi:coenzyme F420-0:L-glutamate ligase/coenzyme F420-1:gamma-L-glutamate ligase
MDVAAATVVTKQAPVGELVDPPVAPGVAASEAPGGDHRAAQQPELAPRATDVLVVTQKVVSKAEGRLVDLRTVEPRPAAVEFARRWDRDARQVEVVLRESAEVLRMERGIVISRTQHGFVCANAGVDASNVANEAEGEVVLMLPEDPDASCGRIAAALIGDTGRHIGIVINDSVGRAWRRGQIGTAIGCWGLDALKDLRGRPDLFGRPLQVSEAAIADEIAALATLLQGQAHESQPVVLVRGHFADPASRGKAADLIRPLEQDLFR